MADTLSVFDKVFFGKQASKQVQHLAKELGIRPEEVVADGIGLLAAAVNHGLHQQGRLNSCWPVMYAMGFWAEASEGKARKVEAHTKEGKLVYVPPEGSLGSAGKR